MHACMCVGSPLIRRICAWILEVSTILNSLAVIGWKCTFFTERIRS